MCDVPGVNTYYAAFENKWLMSWTTFSITATCTCSGSGSRGVGWNET